MMCKDTEAVPVCDLVPFPKYIWETTVHESTGCGYK